MAYPFFVTKWLVRTGIARWLPAVRRRLEGGGRLLHHYSDRVLATPLEICADILKASNGVRAGPLRAGTA